MEFSIVIPAHNLADYLKIYSEAFRDGGQGAKQYCHYVLSHCGFCGKFLWHDGLFILPPAVAHLGRAFREWLRRRLTDHMEQPKLTKADYLNLLPGMWAAMHSKVHPGSLR